MPYIDLHCDTLSLAKSKEYFLNNKGHIDIRRLRTGECVAQCFAIFNEKSGNPDCEYKYLISKYHLFKTVNKSYCHEIQPAISKMNILQNLSESCVSAILTAENGDFIGNKPERVLKAASMGIKMITLTWNDENCLGYPCSSDPFMHARGLKPAGKQTIELMNEAGIIIDVSHLSEGGFWDVAAISRKPFVASHSCCNAIYSHKRNLTDRQIHEIGRLGGVVGINFYNQFINGGTYPTTVSDIAIQAKRIINFAGEDAPALGGDLDGINGELEFSDCTGYIKIAEGLHSKFNARIVDKICYLNALRIFDN